MLACAVVALVTVTALTVMPVPKFAVVVPFTKVVKSPVRFTGLCVSPCGPVFGTTASSSGCDWLTVNTFTPVAISPPVVAVTEYCPAGAVAFTVMFAVIEVGELTTKLLMSTSGKVSVVVPCTQCVLMPLICTVGRLTFWSPTFGVTLLITAGPGLIYTALFRPSVCVPVLTARL